MVLKSYIVFPPSFLQDLLFVEFHFEEGSIYRVKLQCGDYGLMVVSLELDHQQQQSLSSAAHWSEIIEVMSENKILSS